MVLLIILIVTTVSLGASEMSMADGYQVIFNKVFGLENDEIKESIVWDIRLPRILSGFLIGAALSVAGVIFQSVLRNPLADPYTLGVSTGAAFGAVLTIYINMVYSLLIPIMPVAFIFAGLTLVIIMKIAGRTLHSTRLILAGIIIGSIFSAGISLLKYLAGEDVSAMVFWLMGRLSAKSWMDVVILFPLVMISIIISYAMSDDLDVLTLGINEARSIGVDANKRARQFLIIAAVLTAVCVSTSGIIGFVGLIVPHLIRMGFTAKHRYLMPLSALLGGLVLVLADSISRLMFQVEIPVGVITTLIGGPFFIYIYMNKKGEIL
ncbi:iron ABC transporter permease [Acidaminobacter sp. JC074]|uniref:FecCD family ABC transporter permease n=1 Tax=Acidaminobacter sp. JC074 TaxID=2530199 RepID=UPI001F10E0C0|nr:iron ABC transporter permease [Acidaminobacter sp. JC074]